MPAYPSRWGSSAETKTPIVLDNLIDAEIGRADWICRDEIGSRPLNFDCPPVTTPVGDILLTEAGDFLTTESGDFLTHE